MPLPQTGHTRTEGSKPTSPTHTPGTGTDSLPSLHWFPEPTLAVTPLLGCDGGWTQGSVGRLPEGQGALGPPPHQRGPPLAPQSSLNLPFCVRSTLPAQGLSTKCLPALGTSCPRFAPGSCQKDAVSAGVPGLQGSLHGGRRPWEHWERPVQGSVLSAQGQPRGLTDGRNHRSWGLGSLLLPLPGPRVLTVPPRG